MYTVTLLNQKGGGGKSTICQSLAVAACLDGHSAAILDVDPQGSAYEWGKRRKAYTAEAGTLPDPLVFSVTAANVGDEWQRLKEAGADFVFIDTPARLNTEAGNAAARSDLVLIPCKATIKDIERVVPSIKLANINDVKLTCILLNAVRAQGARADEAEEFVKAQNLSVYSARVGYYVAFEDADALGLTPQEMDPKCEASKQIESVYRYTCTLLHDFTSRKVSPYDETTAQAS